MTNEDVLDNIEESITRLMQGFQPPKELDGNPLNAYEKTIYRKGLYDAIDHISYALYKLRSEHG